MTYWYGDSVGSFQKWLTYEELTADVCFVLNFDDPKQKVLYERVVEATREVYAINDKLAEKSAKQFEITLIHKKTALTKEIDELISRVYRLEF